MPRKLLLAAAADWLSLFPYSDDGDLRQWLGEEAAFECWKRGVRNVDAPASWPIVAEVLAELRGTPADVIEGWS